MSIFTDRVRMQFGSHVGERTLVSQLVQPGRVLLSCSHLRGVALEDGFEESCESETRNSH